MRRAVGLLLGLLLLGCGGDDDVASTDATVRLPRAGDEDDPRVDEYLAAVASSGTSTVAATEREVVAVAANLCDNDESEFASLIDGLSSTYSPAELDLVKVDKRNIVAVFCPDQLPVYDAAVE